MGFGGPVWHASTAFASPVWRSPLLLEAAARSELAGVGDAAMGEWTEWTGRAFHLRRRLTDEEAKGIAPAIDVRHTKEARRRLKAVRHILPAEFYAEEA